jgi:hypothetical protein
VSVYCPSHYAKGLSDGYHPENRGWQNWGALAYIFPPQSARELLQHPRVLAHRREGPRDGLKNIDSVVGRCCKRMPAAHITCMSPASRNISEPLPRSGRKRPPLDDVARITF